jgi:hypothetical protein
VWITNLDYTLSRDSGLSVHSRFRRIDFLRRTVPVIAESFGVGTGARLIANPSARSFLNSLRKRALQLSAGLDPGGIAITQAAIVARVFDRVMHLAQFTLDIEAVPQNRLSWGIRQVIAPPDAAAPEWVTAAIEDSITYTTFCERPATDTLVDFYWFRLPPVQLAQRSLLGPFPTGDWTRIKSPDESMLAGVIDTRGPFLARITVLHTAEQVNRLINYGSGATQKQMRQWVSGIELVCLLAIAEVKVHEILIPSDVEPPLPMLLWLQREERRLWLSQSAGVFVENLWAGLAARCDRTRPNPRSPFVYGAVKAECLNAALSLQRLGADVDRYGMGAVVIRMPSCRQEVLLEKIAKFATEAQLLPPPMGIPLDRALALFGDETPLGLMQSLSFAGDPLRFFEIDTQALERLYRATGSSSQTTFPVENENG